VIESHPLHGLRHEEATEEQGDDRVEIGGEGVAGGANAGEHDDDRDGERRDEEGERLGHPQHDDCTEQCQDRLRGVRWAADGRERLLVVAEHRYPLPASVGQGQE
jgi:hypothetical protein